MNKPPYELLDTEDIERATGRDLSHAKQQRDADSTPYTLLEWRTHETGKMIGHLKGEPETSLFAIDESEYAEDAFALAGAFIPDQHDNDEFPTLLDAKSKAELYLRTWLRHHRTLGEELKLINNDRPAQGFAEYVEWLKRMAMGAPCPMKPISEHPGFHEPVPGMDGKSMADFWDAETGQFREDAPIQWRGITQFYAPPDPATIPAPESVQYSYCRVCGCTESDCSQCVERTGSPCSWVAPGLCSACLHRARHINDVMLEHCAFNAGVTNNPPGSLDGLELDEMVNTAAILKEYADHIGRTPMPLELVSPHLAAALYVMTHWKPLAATPGSHHIICNDAHYALVLTHRGEEKRIIIPERFRK